MPGHSSKAQAREKRRRKEAVFEAIKLFPKKTGLLLMVRSLKSCYWPRPVEGQERTGFRPPEGVVWDGGRRGTQPAKQLTGGATAPPAPAELHSGQLGSPPLEGGPMLFFFFAVSWKIDMDPLRDRTDSNSPDEMPFYSYSHTD